LSADQIALTTTDPPPDRRGDRLGRVPGRRQFSGLRKVAVSVGHCDMDIPDGVVDGIRCKLAFPGTRIR
jgi:hypothetical protein